MQFTPFSCPSRVKFGDDEPSCHTFRSTVTFHLDGFQPGTGHSRSGRTCMVHYMATTPLQGVPVMDSLCLRAPCWPCWDLLRTMLVRSLPDSVLLPSHSPFLCQTCLVVWRLSLPTPPPRPTPLTCVSPVHLLYICFHLGVCFLEVCSR